MKAEYYKWYLASDASVVPEKGENVLYYVLLDGPAYGVGYYDGSSIVCCDGASEETSTHVSLGDIDGWMMFSDPDFAKYTLF